MFPLSYTAGQFKWEQGDLGHVNIYIFFLTECILTSDLLGSKADSFFWRRGDEIGKSSNAEVEVMEAFYQRIMVASELSWYSLKYPKLWKLFLLELVCLETSSIFFSIFHLPKTEGERFS